MAYQTPTQAQKNTVQTAAKQRTELRNHQDGYLFASGIIDPEHSDFLSYQFPQYLGTAILEQLGRSEGTAQAEWSWNEIGRTRRGASINSVDTAFGAATIDITTDISAAAADEGYYIVGDTIRTEAGIMMTVSAVGTNGGNQQLTLARQDGTNVQNGDLAAAESIGHIANSQPEYSNAPASRMYLPDEYHNKLNILRRTCVVSGDALTSRVYLKDGRSWYYEQEMIDMEEHARDRENAVMFNVMSPDGATRRTGNGIVPLIEANGVNNFFNGAVTEADLQDHIADLIKESPAKDYTVFCGADFLRDAQNALRDYYVNGGVQFGVFGSGSGLVGIDVQQYRFMGTTINLVHYQMFDDTNALPFSATPTANKFNYSNYSLWLNMGEMQGHQLIRLRHRELDGLQRKLIYKYQNGMMSPNGEGDDGGQASDGRDGFSAHLLSDIGVEVRVYNSHGVLAANG